MIHAYFYINLFIETLQSAAIGYLIGMHLAQRKAYRTLIRMHTLMHYGPEASKMVPKPPVEDHCHILVDAQRNVQ